MKKYPDIEIGDKFGDLLVINKAEFSISPSGSKQKRWLCKCVCNKEIIAHDSNLKSGNTSGCGCKNKKIKDVEAGNVYGKLKVIKEDEAIYAQNGKSGGQRIRIWNCLCECGNVALVRQFDLKSSHTKSCGCAAHTGKTNLKHGHTANKKVSIEYSTWLRIKSRCYNKDDKFYEEYGGRGIKIYEEWINNFESFYAYMGPRPTNKTSIDRFPDNDGNYEPGNVRWATAEEQSNNRRSNRIINYNEEQLTVAELARKMNFSPELLLKRINAGWPQKFWFSQSERKFKF